MPWKDRLTYTAAVAALADGHSRKLIDLDAWTPRAGRRAVKKSTGKTLRQFSDDWLPHSHRPGHRFHGRPAGASAGGHRHPLAFVAANWHTLAVKTDGTLWAWGPNWFGELGDGTIINRSAPVQVGTDTGWATVSAGNLGTVAVKTNGTMWAWGEEFGVNPFTNQLAPVQVGTDTHWAFVAAGRNHALALRW